MQIRVLPQLTDDDTARVLATAERARVHDGTAPLNDAARIGLESSAPGLEHLLAVADDGTLLGYGQLDPATGPPTGQLLVDPPVRGRGLGRALAERMLARRPETRLWSFGRLPAAEALAARLDLTVERELLIMEAPLDEPVAVPPVPPGVTIDTFHHDRDAAAWVEVNARAFADHPEQGRMTAADLAAREAEPWFDPAGFFLARRDGRLLGYHWTKVHTETDPPQGEVYVLGVDPRAGRSGLGRLLLATGMEHLRRLGLGSVLLYVEAGAEHVVRLYRSANFVVTHRDVSYAPAPAHP